MIRLIKRALRFWIIANLEKRGYRVTFPDYLEGLLRDRCMQIPYTHLLARLNQLIDMPSFIQVGAYDGISHDPLVEAIKSYPMTGVLIEPQPEVYVKLEHLYAENTLIKTLNIAIHPQEKSLCLYRIIDGYDINGYRHSGASSLTSANPDHLLKHLAEEYRDKKNLETISVPCKTLKEVVNSMECKKINLLQVDAEGTDGMILESFDWEKCKPELIQFEWIHMEREDLAFWINKLRGMGYLFSRGEQDLSAFLPILAK